MRERLSKGETPRILPPEVLPLSRLQLRRALDFVRGDVTTDEWEEFLRSIQDFNSRALENQDLPLYLLLEGKDGNLGNLVRGAHLIPLLREWGEREPIIVTNHPELFAGNLTLSPSQEKETPGYLLQSPGCLLRGTQITKAILLQPTRNDNILTPAVAFYLAIIKRVDSLQWDMDRLPVKGEWKNLNQLQRLQINAFAFFGRFVDQFPRSEISFSTWAKNKAEEIVRRLNLKEYEIPLLVYSDASKFRFADKKWPPEHYLKVLASLHQTWGEKMRLILLTGVTHPWVTEDLSSLLREHDLPHSLVEKLPDLGQFGATLAQLQEKRAVLLGTESLVAGHLAPILGIWSVVLGWGDQDWHRFYRPVEPGCTLVEGLLGGKPEPEQVIEALNRRIAWHLKSGVPATAPKS